MLASVVDVKPFPPCTLMNVKVYLVSEILKLGVFREDLNYSGILAVHRLPVGVAFQMDWALHVVSFTATYWPAGIIPLKRWNLHN